MRNDDPDSESVDLIPRQVIRFVARFDRREYWLAHEELEELWQEDRSDFYKGLIQVAAGFVHVDRENWNGARTLMKSALEYLDGYPNQHRHFDVEAVRRATRRALREVGFLAEGKASDFDDAARFRLAQCFAGDVRPGAVEDVELPYRVRRYEEGYRPVPRGPIDDKDD